MKNDITTYFIYDINKHFTGEFMVQSWVQNAKYEVWWWLAMIFIG